MATDFPAYDHDILEGILGFLDKQNYLSFASVLTQWKKAWGQHPTVTSRRWAVQSRSCLDWARACGLEIWDSPCLFAAAEGRLDVLQHAVALGYSREGMPICEWAAGAGHLEVVKWCRAKGYPWGWSSIRAAEKGHLEVLKWCVANGCPINVGTPSLQARDEIISPRGHYRGKRPCREERAFDVVGAAAKAGHLETLMWYVGQGYPWTMGASYMAAQGGHLDVVMWLQTNGYHWDLATMAGAAGAGHLEILKWCKANGCPWNESTLACAAGGGNLEVVKWCFANGHTALYDQIVALDTAASWGHLEVVQFMRANGCPWGFAVCYFAACGGHLEVLKWCVANGCPWRHPAKYDAISAFKGSVSMMVWAALNDCPWFSESGLDVLCEHAASGGNLEVLQWCAGHRPLPIRQVSQEAALKGQVHVLEWLRADGKMSDVCEAKDLCTIAARSGSLETVKWCRANSFPWNSFTSTAAMKSGNMEVLQWCRANGCPWDKRTFEEAILQDGIEAVAFCRANGCPVDARSIRSRVEDEDDEMSEWCRDHLLWEPGGHEQESL